MTVCFCVKGNPPDKRDTGGEHQRRPSPGRAVSHCLLFLILPTLIPPCTESSTNNQHGWKQETFSLMTPEFWGKHGRRGRTRDVSTMLWKSESSRKLTTVKFKSAPASVLLRERCALMQEAALCAAGHDSDRCQTTWFRSKVCQRSGKRHARRGTSA